MANVVLQNVSKSFRTKSSVQNQVIRPLSLEVHSGEFLVLLGPSGCGKSTLLRMIAGLETTDSGRILIAGRDVTNVEPQHRNVAMVFQSYALYPHLSVRDNMNFALKNKNEPPQTIKEKTDSIAELLGLTNFLDRKPRELSGGQRQRVALGRALVRETPVILFDEPLSNLDAHLRSQMRIEIKKIHQRLKNTMIYVTHDQVEATTMGDRIAILNRGEIEQVGSPEEVYCKPATPFIAQFIGSPEINLIEAKSAALLGLKPGQMHAIRPECIQLGHGPYRGTVLLTENLGSQSLIHVETEVGPLRILQQGQCTIRSGEAITFNFDREKVVTFDINSRMRTADPNSKTKVEVHV